MTYNFDFSTLPFRVRGVLPTTVVERDPVVEEQLTRHAYRPRRGDEQPENCTAIYHMADGDWLELVVGLESLVGQRELPPGQLISVERI